MKTSFPIACEQFAQRDSLLAKAVQLRKTADLHSSKRALTMHAMIAERAWLNHQLTPLKKQMNKECALETYTFKRTEQAFLAAYDRSFNKVLAKNIYEQALMKADKRMQNLRLRHKKVLKDATKACLLEFKQALRAPPVKKLETFQASLKVPFIAHAHSSLAILLSNVRLRDDTPVDPYNPYAVVVYRALELTAH